MKSVATITAVQIEGNLIAPDMTSLVLTGSIKGQAPEDFGFAKTDKLADEIATAWGDAKAYWTAFQRALMWLNADDPATTVTREWAVPLLRSLGYDPVYTAKAEVVDGQTYAISHRAEPGENKPPIHIIGCRVKVDERPPSGTPRLSAHALVQEYLNKTEHLWAIATNGLRWRLLRDSSLMTRLTYIEFDLEQILNGENFAEFGLFYRLFHRSRLPQGMDDADKCLLEYYHQEALQQGGRVRDRLRDGVEQALIQLGTGFLQHPNNEHLRQKFSNNYELTYYRQLLRLIYRLLFLMVAESRNLLLIEEDTEKERIYREYYSIERLRELAERPSWRREGFQDLWRGLWVTFLLFDENWRGKLLGLSPLNGDLFGSNTLPDLSNCALDNHDLLVAIRHLSLYQDKGQLRRVNYAALDVEELGSVYESLLDFHPQVIQRQGKYEFALVFGSDAKGTVQGTERKTTGSYYTPPQLVQQLIKTALEPVITEKILDLKAPQELDKALLSLKVVDPACGSGHFLLAAARRIGKKLAKVRTGEAEPGQEPLRAAIRDVIQNCIYGVDLNPLAVDLCKVALWIEGFSRGKPLNFLDHRIKCGNSLVGVLDLSCLDEGIPDEAFKAVTGDNKQLSVQFKKRNKQERNNKNQFSLGDLELGRTQYTESWRELGEIPETTPQEVKDKEKRYQETRKNQRWWQDYSACNLWTTAFFMPLTEQNLQLLPTTAALTQLLRGNTSTQEIVEAANKLAQEKRFFHWCLEFPEVFEAGGFDCVLGNPPWERIKLQEKEFFASRSLEIANAANKAAREKLIKELSQKNPTLAQAWEEAKHDADAQSKFIRESARFPLTAIGDINTYAVFAETTKKLISSQGRVGIIVPTGIATDDTCKKFFGDLTQKQALANLYDFENREKLFSAVDSRMKFSLLSISGKPVKQGNFGFFLTQSKQIENAARQFQLAPQDIALLNPNTLTCPVFRTRTDAEITKKIYQRIPVLENECTGSNPWGISFMSMFHMANDSHLFLTTDYESVGSSLRLNTNYESVSSSLQLLPLYEAKMFHQFDHRWATYEAGETRDVTLAEKCDANFQVQPRYWVSRSEVENKLDGKWNKEWLLAFRDICRSTDERTAIFSLLPKVAINHKAPLIFTSQTQTKFYCLLLANLNSLVFDFVTRQKIGGTSFSYFILKQLPIIPPEAYTPEDIEFISSRVLELVYTTWDMQSFAQDIWRESGIESRESIVKQWEECNGQSIFSVLSGSTSLERGNELGTDVLSSNESISQGRNLRNDFSDSQSSSIDSSQYSRGLRKGESRRIHPISPDSSRIAQGTGDSFNLIGTSEIDNKSNSSSNSQAMRNSGQNASFADSFNPEQEGVNRESRIKSRESENTTHDSRLTTPDLPIPPFMWNPNRRALLRAEVDAYYAKLYGITRDELRYILDPADVYGADFPSETFRVLKNNEIKKFGEYRTQRLVLEAWDRMFK